MIYFDNASSTPPSSSVIKVMHDALNTYYANPSSLHTLGIQARKRMNQAKRNIASMLNVDRQSIIFTSSGTEANNLALKGVYYANRGGDVITSTIEHHSVSYTTAFLETLGVKVHYIPVDTRGYLDLAILEETLKKHHVALVSIIYANNEVGTVQDIDTIKKLTKSHGALLHLDMVQVPLHKHIDLTALGCDLASFSAHKFFGPRGAGLLYKKPGVEIIPQMHGGQHEFKLRAGTENLVGIIGMETALKETIENLDVRENKTNHLAHHLLRKLNESGLDYRLNGPSLNQPRLLATLNIGFKDQDAQVLSFALNQRNIFVTLGSACDSESIEPSHVLRAMNVPNDYIKGSMRFSIAETMQEKDIEYTVDVLKSIIRSEVALIE